MKSGRIRYKFAKRLLRLIELPCCPVSNDQVWIYIPIGGVQAERAPTFANGLGVLAKMHMSVTNTVLYTFRPRIIWTKAKRDLKLDQGFASAPQLR